MSAMTLPGDSPSLVSREATYNCQTCFKNFWTLDELNTHSHSQEEIGFVCKICGTSAVNRKQLGEHLISQHSVDYLHFCVVCGKGFKSYSGYYDHQRTYHGTGPVCPVCGKCFARHSHLQHHMTNSHNTTSHEQLSKQYNT